MASKAKDVQLYKDENAFIAAAYRHLRASLTDFAIGARIGPSSAHCRPLLEVAVLVDLLGDFAAASNDRAFFIAHVGRGLEMVVQQIDNDPAPRRPQ